MRDLCYGIFPFNEVVLRREHTMLPSWIIFRLKLRTLFFDFQETGNF